MSQIRGVEPRKREAYSLYDERFLGEGNKVAGHLWNLS
jgi:hypothetical protein